MFVGLDVFFVFCRWVSTTTKPNQRCCMLGQAQYCDGVKGKFTVSFSAQFVYGPCWLAL